MRKKSALCMTVLFLTSLNFSVSEAGVDQDKKETNKTLLAQETNIAEVKLTEQELAQKRALRTEASRTKKASPTINANGKSTSHIPTKNSFSQNGASLEKGQADAFRGSLDGVVLSREELMHLGEGLENEAARTSASPLADGDKMEEEKSFRINGEIRYSYLRNRGWEKHNGFNSNDSQLRVRLYGRQKLNNDWFLYGMLEGKKHFLDDSKDDLLNSHRIYVTGLTGITSLTAGKFGYLMAEGNIYDSEFRGVSMSADNPPWLYTAALGETGAKGRTILGTATRIGESFDYTFGLYKFDEDDWGKNAATIVQIGGNYYLDQVKLGAMYLRSDDSSDTTGKNGYVLSARYRTMKPWRAGSWSIYVNYYDQAWSTYRNHTMNGIGNSLRGFKGYGVGLEYALAPNVGSNLEYYKLKDKDLGDSGHTLWGSVSYYF